MSLGTKSVISQSELCTRRDSKGCPLMSVTTPADSAICCLWDRAEIQSRNWGVAAAAAPTAAPIAPPPVVHAALCVAKYGIEVPATTPPAGARSHHADWPGSVERTAFCGFRDSIATSTLT